MAIFAFDCPHCSTKKIALIVIAGETLDQYVDHPDAAAYLLCPGCRMPSCALLTRDGSDEVVEPSDWHNEDGDIENLGWQFKQIWPAAAEPNVPENLPPDVRRIYLQAERNFPVEGNEEAAGTMYRKALDVGLKKIDSDTNGVLAVRIKKLAGEHKLTPDIAQWADHIRDLGNDAAHEAEPPSRAELTDLRNFTEMVMRYLFSLPALVQKRRADVGSIAM